VEKGAVGEVNNVDTERPAPRKYRIDRDALSYNTSEEMAQVQPSYSLLAKNCIESMGGGTPVCFILAI
jgi:hypothetical protein